MSKVKRKKRPLAGRGRKAADPGSEIISLRVSGAVKQLLERHAAAKGRCLSALLREIVDDWVTRQSLPVTGGDEAAAWPEKPFPPARRSRPAAGPLS